MPSTSPAVASPAEADAAPAPSSPQPLAWSTREAARRIGISRALLYELLAAGEIASLKVGARRLILDTECRRFLTARQAESAGW